MKTRLKYALEKTITSNIKHVSIWMEQISNNEITYDDVNMIFSNENISAANKSALTNPTDNKTKLLKIYFDLREVLSGKPYGV